MRLVFLSWLSLLLLFSTGCGEVNPRKEISGKVKLRGTNLDAGTIDFRPIEGTVAAGLPSTTAGAVITDGIYQIGAEYGLVPGKYKVLISSGDGITPDNEEGIPGPSGNFVSKDRIPPQFNVNSQVEIEVTDVGENIFDFEIP